MTFICPVHGPYHPLNTGTSVAICPACQIDPRTRAPAVPTRLWQTCPICQGCGTVPADFYARLGVGTSTAREQCRRCEGTGTIEQPVAITPGPLPTDNA